MVKIQYVSDIHLEFRGNNFKSIIKPTGDVLCLAGDICACANPDDFKFLVNFLTYNSPKFKHIFHVAGNHEYYSAGVKKIGLGNTMQYVDKILRDLEKTISNYHYLNCRSYLLEMDRKKYLFCGASLWSNIKKDDYDEVAKGMNDYYYIYYAAASKNENGEVIKHAVKFNVPEMVRLHTKHRAFIRKIVKENIPIILITHHKPVADATTVDILTQAYETDLTSIITPNVKLAIHGHTHIHYDKTIGGVRYVSNPKGYPEQKTRYIDNIVVEI